MNHTAGVFDVVNSMIPADAPCKYAGQSYMAPQNPDHQFTFDELVGVVAQCNLSYWEPWLGRYHYSNTGYTLLGKIIERISGVPYSDFIMTNLVRPNGFIDTTAPFLATDTKIPDPFAIGYLLQEGKLTEITSDNLSGNVAEGNLISTPKELALWIKLLMTGNAGIDKKYVEMMKDCTIKEGGTSCYALGVENRLGIGYGHTGAHNGYLSIMGYNPADGVTVVLFFNRFGGPRIFYWIFVIFFSDLFS